MTPTITGHSSTNAHDTESDTATETAIATAFDSGSDVGSYWGSNGEGAYSETQFESDTSSDTTTTTFNFTDSVPSLGASDTFNSSATATYHDTDDDTYTSNYNESGSAPNSGIGNANADQYNLINCELGSLTAGRGDTPIGAFENGEDDETDDGTQTFVGGALLNDSGSDTENAYDISHNPNEQINNAATLGSSGVLQLVQRLGV